MTDHDPPDEDHACLLVTEVPNLSLGIRATFREYAIVSIPQARTFLQELAEHTDTRAQLGLQADEIDEALLLIGPPASMAVGPVFDYRTIPCGIPLEGPPAHFGPELAPQAPVSDDEGEPDA